MPCNTCCPWAQVDSPELVKCLADKTNQLVVDIVGQVLCTHNNAAVHALVRMR